MKKTLLLLSAQSPRRPKLDVVAEFEEIRNGIRRSDARGILNVEHEYGTTGESYADKIVDYKPMLVHFSGHGDGEGALVFEDEEVAGITGVTGVLRANADAIKCVVLNACFTDGLAAQLAEDIDAVVAIRGRVSDGHARMFAVGFYVALAQGLSYFQAYHFSLSRLDLIGFQSSSMFVLHSREGRENTRPFQAEHELLVKKGRWRRRAHGATYFAVGVFVAVTAQSVVASRAPEPASCESCRRELGAEAVQSCANSFVRLPADAEMVTDRSQCLQTIQQHITLCGPLLERIDGP